MKAKELWFVIAGLVLLNCLTAFYFLSKESNAAGVFGKEETVAEIGKSEITREEWLNELESRYGQDILREMIDQKVIKQMADKNKITIPASDVDRELRMFQITYGGSVQGDEDKKKWEKQIELSLMLEELLTKDAVVPEKEIKSYYETNKGMFSVPASYHLSHIILKTKEEAEKTTKELDQGSSFKALAMEKSIDEFSAGGGGDIGFINTEDERYPSEYLDTASRLKTGEWSRPFKTGQGYAVILLQGKMDEKKYSFDDVKNEIRRQIALEQMETPASASALWDEAGVNWFYQK